MKEADGLTIIIDNYDSFTFNLYQYIGSVNPNIQVYRNDAISVEEVLTLTPAHIVISPGPCFPKDAGISVELIKAAGMAGIPLLGVCLGHQAIGEAFGGKVVHAPVPYHGKADTVRIKGSSVIFQGLEDEITVGRYHSLIIDKESLPEELEIIAESRDGIIMGIQSGNIFGIQFHPESILTPDGMKVISNFLEL